MDSWDQLCGFNKTFIHPYHKIGRFVTHPLRRSGMVLPQGATEGNDPTAGNESGRRQAIEAVFEVAFDDLGSCPSITA